MGASESEERERVLPWHGRSVAGTRTWQSPEYFSYTNFAQSALRSHASQQSCSGETRA